MESKPGYVIAGVKEKEKESSLNADESKMSVSGEEKTGESMTVSERKISGVRPWRIITQHVPRAFLDLLIAGVGYLL